MLCLRSLYLPPQQFSYLRLSGRADHSQLDQGHPRVRGLCFDNQRCVCSCWLLHVHWLHSRYRPETADYRPGCNHISSSSFRRHIWKLLQGRWPGDIWALLFRPQHRNHVSPGVLCYTRGKCWGKRGNSHERVSPFAPSSLSPQVVSNVLCSRELSKAEHAGLTVLIVTVCTSMSLAFDCLGVVLELNVSCCLPGSVVFIDLFMFLFFFLWRILLSLYHPGRSERHASDLHHSICLLPQTVPWTVVSGWKPDTVYPDFNRHGCHDHWFDHDWAGPTRLFPWSGNVLLCGCQYIWHGAACMTTTLI